MKTIKPFFKIVISLLWLSFSITNAKAGDITDGIAKALESGDAKSLSGYFNGNVELAIQEIEGIYSKDQAELILKNFFTSHKPTGFVILHRGGKDSSKYAIGNLSTPTINYRVTILIKLKGENPYIHQLRIEEENVE
jgi:hypothetical protein